MKSHLFGSGNAEDGERIVEHDLYAPAEGRRAPVKYRTTVENLRAWNNLSGNDIQAATC